MMIACTISVFTRIHCVLRKLNHFEAFLITKVIHSIVYFGVTGVYFADLKGEKPWQTLVIALVHVKAERSDRQSTVREQGGVP